MEERVSIGSSYQETPFVLLVLTAVTGIGVGLSLLGFHPEWAYGLLAVGGATAAMAGGRALLISRGRRWITQTDDGFLYEDRRGKFDFPDHDITAFGTWATVRLSNGNPKGVIREGVLVLTAEELNTRLPFRYEYPAGRIDPLDEFIERNLKRLALAAEQLVRSGGTLTGDGWRLDRSQFEYTQNKSSAAVPTDSLTAIEVIDGQVSVWVKDDPKPIARFPAASCNGLVLVRWFNARHTSTPHPDDAGTGLGRVLFERDRSWSSGHLLVALVVAPLVMAAGGWVLSIAGERRQDQTSLTILGGGLVVVPSILLGVMWAHRVNVFRCHIRGLSRITTRESVELLFTDVTVFTYSAVRQYVNGGYTGTTVTLTFQTANPDLPALTYTQTSKKIEAELDNLRDALSGMMSAAMRKRLDAGETVRWADGLRFRSDGLELGLIAGRLSTAENRLRPYSTVAYQVQDGLFYLYEKDSQKVLYTLAISAPNFFPGLVLLASYLYPPTPKDDDTEPDRTPAAAD